MAEQLRLAIAVLAAGRSQRFGEEDKLRVPFRGKALGLHATDTLGRVDAEVRIVVTSDLAHICARGWEASGFAPVKNPNADEGMGTSVAVAARIARRAGVEALLIALADMPLVPRRHFQALVEAAGEARANAIIASSHGSARMPPAIFSSDRFNALADLAGDAGARGLLAQAELITCPPEWLADIDTPDALAALS